MSSDTLPAGAPGTLGIDGELTIFRAEEIRRMLLAEPPPQAVDLSGVSEIDTAGVQLLLAARQSAIARDARFEIVARSAAVDELFALYGLNPLFGVPAGAGAAVEATS